MDTLNLKPRLIIIAGPTGVGKSDLAMKLTGEFGGEIISADSMQVYRHMDIGTAKPTVEDRARVKHHLIDVVDPDETFNAALYTERARGVIREGQRERNVFWVVGGTGLYIRSLTGGLVEGPGASESLRESYRREMKERGTRYLYDRLKEKDEEAARRIHPNDAIRLLRALEFIELSGESLLSLQREHRFQDRPYECLKIGLQEERGRLYEKIDTRCDGMIKKGLFAEIENLLSMGYSDSLKPMQSLGYRHILQYVKGLQTLDEAVDRMKSDTRSYAKRQMTWFRADDEIVWFHPAEVEGIRRKVQLFLHPGGR